MNFSFLIIGRYLLLPCGDSVLVEELRSALAEGTLIQIPECPECSKPIPFLHRFKKEMFAKKKEITRVVDVFFALKSGVPKLKKELLEEVKGANINLFLKKLKAKI